MFSKFASEVPQVQANFGIGTLAMTSAQSPPVGDGMVVYENVSKYFPVRVRSGHEDRAELMVALDRISASVRRGELITLLGPSGCGKTTLLRLSAGLLAADEGRITIDGTPVRAPRKDACMVFQNFGLLPWRTAMGNVEFPLEIDGVGLAERRNLARHFIDLVGLSAFAEHFPHELSGGMQQRVGIARALMRKPILIFMDEPFGALDAQTREQLQEDFLRIWSRTGATVVFVTHSIDEALFLSDRIFVFNTAPGRIRTIVESPVARERLCGDVRAHPEFGKYRAELRDMLRSDA
jgi:NitT/TauT family transport system ATP-binding protein